MTKETRNPNVRKFNGASWSFGLRASGFVIRYSVSCAAALGLAVAGHAAGILTLHSRSGQFTVHGLPLMTAPYVSSTAAVSFVRLDPALAAVSAERIKGALLDELGLTDQWQGGVTLTIHPVMEDNEPIEITSMHFQNGWKYRLSLPEQVDRARFIKAVVEVLIFEIANRKAGVRAAELPPWLVPGLARYLQATTVSGLALEPRTAFLGKTRNADALASVRDSLRKSRGLSIDQLNWPSEQLVTDDQNALYENCAQLLVYDLLRLKNGRVCMIDMLKRLHLSLNWQTAFFQAYGKQFQRLADLDKWWSLRLVQFSQKEPFAAFTLQEQARQLDSILEVTSLARTNADALPVASTADLQTVIANWEWARQLELLQQKIGLLRALQTRANGPLRTWIGEYILVLDQYLAAHDRQPVHHGRNALPPNGMVLRQNVIRRLNDLDARRHALKEPAQN